MLGIRVIPLVLLAIRIIAAAGLFLIVAASPSHNAMPSLVMQSFIVGWPALTLAGFIVDLPRTRRGQLAILALDSVFAFFLLLQNAPLAALPLILAHGIAWRAQGGQWPFSPTLPPFLLLWLGLWIFLPNMPLQWIESHPTNYDIYRWGAPLAILVIAFRLEEMRAAGFARLSGDIWLDPILTTHQPFSYDFTKWTEQVVALLGSNQTDCIVCLISRDGHLQIFGRPPDGLDRPGLARALANSSTWLPEKMTTLLDRRRRGVMASENVEQKAPALMLLQRLTISARKISIGSHSGAVIIAHDLPSNAILQHEISVIDQAVDDVIDRVSNTIEMRRAFMAEAREVARRDLHDGVLQTLAAIRLRLQTIAQGRQSEQSALVGEIRTTADIIALEQERLRTLLEMNAGADRAVNLVETLRVAVETIALQWEVDLTFQTDEVAIPMQLDSANNIEYLLREVVANATRHSNAKIFSLSLAIRDSDLIISLVDSSNNGSDDAIHSGLNNPLVSQSLKQRLQLVNGRAYQEGLKSGTLLSIAIPLLYEEDE